MDEMSVEPRIEEICVVATSTAAGASIVEETGWTVEEGAIPSLRFPQKLWRIVNECQTGAIGWGSDGQTVKLNYKSFQDEYLNGPNSSFKTSNIASFIRQLNLYGFRKLATHGREQRTRTEQQQLQQQQLQQQQIQDEHEFLHEHFRAGRLDLLSRVCRKTVAKRPANATAASRNKPVAAATVVAASTHSTTAILPKKERQGLTRLQMCQLALTKALEQATRQYKKERFWLQLPNECVSKDALKPKYEPQTNSDIQIVFQDLSELQENLQIIDVSASGEFINCQDKNQWEEVFTLPKETSISISVPYC